MRDGVLETEVERSRIFFERIDRFRLLGLVISVNQAERAVRFLFEGIANAFAVGLPQPRLVIERSPRAAHVLARGDADACEQRIGLDGFPDTGAKVSDSLGIIAVF